MQKGSLGCLGRVGDSAEWDYSTDRLLGAKFWGGLRSVCKQRSGRESSAETPGKNRTQVGKWDGRGSTSFLLRFVSMCDFFSTITATFSQLLFISNAVLSDSL